eukprot:35134_1
MNTLRLLIYAILLCIIQPHIFPKWFPFTPLLPICYRYSLAADAERTIDGIICGCVYGLYFMVMALPVSFLLWIPYHWCLLLAYSSVIVLYNRDLIGLDCENCANNQWFKLWLNVFFNPPLLMAWHIASYFGGQQSAPLASIIDDDICIGSLPCSNKNVLTLFNDPFHVRCVINLCEESVGPIHQYRTRNMKQLHLPTLDATVPQIKDIERGIGFIDTFVKSKDKKKERYRTSVYSLQSGKRSFCSNGSVLAHVTAYETRGCNAFIEHKKKIGFQCDAL